MARNSKLEARKIRHRTLRKRLAGTAARPRLVVFRSARHIYVQVIDDLAQKTLVAASDMPAKADRAAASKTVRKTERAKEVGIAIAKKCLEKGISMVVFDRAGFKYHGRISAVAAGAREAGLQF